MKLGDLIEQYRKELGISQRQFAIKCGLSNGYISMIEKGMNPKTRKPITPTLSQLKKLADGMNTTVMEIMEQVEDMPVTIDMQANEKPTPESESGLSAEAMSIAYAFDRAKEKDKATVRLVLSDYMDAPLLIAARSGINFEYSPELDGIDIGDDDPVIP